MMLVIGIGPTGTLTQNSIASNLCSASIIDCNCVRLVFRSRCCILPD